MVAPQVPGEGFSDSERQILGRYFTNIDSSIFVVHNLPEIVKGALFARYSRSSKSLKRLFLDEFYKPKKENFNIPESENSAGSERATNLYERVLDRYGDDSVAQLGSAHLACEDVSNVLTKILERGRLASYLEQSTRYIDYGSKKHGSYRYVTPPELRKTEFEGRYVVLMDSLFVLYQKIVERCKKHFEEKFPLDSKKHSKSAWNTSIRAQAYDVARGILPASTFSNVGIFASGQALERLILRLKASPLLEANQCADVALKELRKVVPEFLKRVDIADRGGVWVKYLNKNKRDTNVASKHSVKLNYKPHGVSHDISVDLVNWDTDGERKIVAAILYETGTISLKTALNQSENLTNDASREIILAYCGERTNRRHLPGRALECTDYHFDILSDYGAFRDLQRHRMMTIDWQPLTTQLGYQTPEELDAIEMRQEWDRAMESAARLHDEINAGLGPLQAQYVVPLAYRIRYAIKLNARQAMYMIELRSGEQAHNNYRRVVLDMHNQIRYKAQHTAVIEAMKFVGKPTEQLARFSTAERTVAGRQLKADLEFEA